ncbi:MAG: sulfite exporter TauE/SafE family protein [Alphaproteobacteria bacterium]|nr:sulfite exporter TauE/SafE family protein [Alphaproteobacteria bacterium]
MSGEMTAVEIALFAGTSFAAAVVAGVAGFAFGLVAAGVWLHVLTPLQTTAMIVALGMLVQGQAVWKLRHALDWRRLRPFLIGGALGVPVGVELLRWAAPAQVRVAVGAFLTVYCLYALARPALKPAAGAGPAADGGIGVLSGALGGLTGLGGILPTIWCGLRGWPKDAQRAVFQPVAVAIHAMTIAWLGGAGVLDVRSVQLFAMALPAVILGTWLGLRLYGLLDETGFRRVVLMLLLVSGVVLLVVNG